jgi:hypothetical protein
MEPAVYTLAVVRPQPPALWARLEAALAAQGAPAISMAHEDGRVVFTGATADFMVRARVAQALEEVCGHGEQWRAFRAVEEPRSRLRSLYALPGGR